MENQYSYLCIKNKNNYNCTKFDSFLEANKYYTNKKITNNPYIIRISKYIPLFLHNYIINYKLLNSKRLSDIH